MRRFRTFTRGFVANLVELDFFKVSQRGFGRPPCFIFLALFALPPLVEQERRGRGVANKRLHSVPYSIDSMRRSGINQDIAITTYSARAIHGRTKAKGIANR